MDCAEAADCFVRVPLGATLDLLVMARVAVMYVPTKMLKKARTPKAANIPSTAGSRTLQSKPSPKAMSPRADHPALQSQRSATTSPRPEQFTADGQSIRRTLI